jgi:hypothetical protein
MRWMPPVILLLNLVHVNAYLELLFFKRGIMQKFTQKKLQSKACSMVLKNGVVFIMQMEVSTVKV